MQNPISPATAERIKTTKAFLLLDLYDQGIGQAGDELIDRYDALLAACKEAVASLEAFTDNPGIRGLDMCRKAIAKAEGR